jgi:hypothetical protein
MANMPASVQTDRISAPKENRSKCSNPQKNGNKYISTVECSCAIEWGKIYNSHH